ncbi:uncharacterized protein LOC101222903 isoform X5 [Cucumis sativus]|uniref:uncharacterized protein LOC101222903 isoform X5 n=1 Tax=Cucumis sativus TaxID=3659 RepID=UPI0012F51D71|nr:uncharacterized protein LOC101222903 isoform X5 [Cucumis sativus]
MGGSWHSHGLNSALAGKGVLVLDKVFQNLKSSELFQKGATVAEFLSGFPIHVRGHTFQGSSNISKPQFTKLLKQVTSHISSISNIYVHDGAIGPRSTGNVNIRMISDGPSSVLAFSNIIWETSSRAISQDSCPLTVYSAESISPGVRNSIGLGTEGDKGFIAADIEHSMLILCGTAFSDINGTKETLVALSEPVIFARGGLPLPGSSRTIPSASKLSPGQAAYHFLAGYQNGKFVPAFHNGPSSIDPLELAKALMFVLKEQQIPSFLVNAKGIESAGKELVTLVESTLSMNIPPFQAKGGEIKRRYKSFLSGKYQQLPEGFSF